MQQQGAAAERRRADDRALAQVGDTGGIIGDQHVTCIFARQERGNDETRRLRRRHVLHAVDGRVDAAGEHGLLDFLHEQALAARLGERTVLDRIARGLDGDDLDRVGRSQRRDGPRQSVADQTGLGEREPAAARAEPKKRCRHGAALA